MKTYRFYKTTSNEWFIDIPKFPFKKRWLEMVCGADDLLDKLAKGNNEVKIEIGSRYKKRDYSDVLLLQKVLGTWKGATYKPLLTRLQNRGFGKNKLWLCPATLYVFFKYPKKIYFRVVN